MPRYLRPNIEVASSHVEGVVVPTAEKAQDDPSTPVRNRIPVHTPTSLSNLLAGRVVGITPEISQSDSYQSGNENLLRRPISVDGTSLPDHLYTRGLLGGRHSDVTII